MLLRLAWRNLGRQKKRSALTAVAMAVVIALSMFMSSMTSGMSALTETAVVDRAIGHVHLNHADYPDTMSPYDSVSGADALFEALRGRADVEAVNGRVYAFGLFSRDTGEADTGDASVGQLMGTDLTMEARLTGLDQQVRSGAYPPSGSGEEVLVGYRLAEDLGLEVGGDLLVVTQALDGTFGQGIYRVAGVHRTGNNTLDKSVVMDLDEARRITAQGDEVHEVVVLTSGDRSTIEAFVADARTQWPALSVRPWWEIRPEVVDMMAMTDGVNQVFTLVVLFVAAFGVINTLLMSVYERTRELGVMQAVGMRPGRVVQLVLVESLVLALVSAVLGVLLGGLLDLYLMQVGIDLAVNDQGEGFQISGVTMDAVLYGAFKLEHVVVPTLTLFAVSALGSLWPALRAARLDPVAAMRQD